MYVLTRTKIKHKNDKTVIEGMYSSDRGDLPVKKREVVLSSHNDIPFTALISTNKNAYKTSIVCDYNTDAYSLINETRLRSFAFRSPIGLKVFLPV